MKRKFQRLLYKIGKIDWVNFLLPLVGILLAFFVFRIIEVKHITYSSTTSLISNILTVNGVFSAILITYLFTRISWVKDRKLETFNEAIGYSQKITEFRRILNILTKYYNVWQDDNQTKNLLDHSKYKHIDFYDFRLASISDYKPKDYELIRQLQKEDNYSDGQSVLYLAMDSLVRQRKSEYYWQEELYKDYEHKGIYNFSIVEKWLECDIMDTIAYWMNDNYMMIQFYNLRTHFDELKQAASRINKKYLDYEINNKLIRELAEDMSSYYLKNLYSTLQYLRKGIESLNLLVLILISASLLFGVLLPLIYLLVITESIFYPNVMALIASINAGMIGYFLLKFPFMIRDEIKWT